MGIAARPAASRASALIIRVSSRMASARYNASYTVNPVAFASANQPFRKRRLEPNSRVRRDSLRLNWCQLLASEALESSSGPVAGDGSRVLDRAGVKRTGRRENSTITATCDALW
jgi:hypothetical protein